MSGIFQQVMYELGIKQYKSSSYNPESQGALERFHQTLKNMIDLTALTQKKIGMKAYICFYLLQGNLYKSLLGSAHLN